MMPSTLIVNTIMDFKASIPYISHPFGLISTWFKLNLKGD